MTTMYESRIMLPFQLMSKTIFQFNRLGGSKLYVVAGSCLNTRSSALRKELPRYLGIQLRRRFPVTLSLTLPRNINKQTSKNGGLARRDPGIFVPSTRGALSQNRFLFEERFPQESSHNVLDHEQNHAFHH